ncbi:5'-3' exoribonuclease 1 [Halotydeus destructor]|nr:5'-3' exoribonuclease 1 [Halotydeus destructor]
MGVPKFYRWISERYPCLSEVVREHQIPEYDNLYLDMNGIIHNCSHPNDDDVHFRISEEQIFQDIFRYIEFLFRMIKPRKVFFMAIDGVAPRAKMNQQRGRRFRSAKEAETREQEAQARGEILPSEARFDSNCITPGTEFMHKLHQQLKYFVAMKMSKDELWKPVKVYLSGHETPGEGEHKVMDFIRSEKSKPDYNPNTRHCLYGLDADLLMLGLCSHEPHFSLLREEVKFIKSKTVKKVTTRSTNPDVITFHLLHLSLLRDYLSHEFSALKTTLPFEFNLENVIDDWILMGFLVGNDFIPHLPHFHINKNALTNLYKIYIDVLPSLGGYMNESGKLNLERFGKFLEKVSEIDVENFTEVYADLRYFKSKCSIKDKRRELEPFYDDTELLTVEQALQNGLFKPLIPEANGKSGNGFSVLPVDVPADLPSEVSPFALDDPESGLDGEDEFSEVEEEKEEEDTFDEEFRLHKKTYYETKMCYENADKDVLKEQALCYIRAIQWNLHYYYNGCISWSWYYPHHYAPYISDVKDFSEADLVYDFGKPFRPFDQLLAVLPAGSKDLLPKAYQRLLIDERSPLKEFYPDKFELDMNEKQQSWEAVVKIPFIDEDRLLKAADECSILFSAGEKKRNTHGPHWLFTYSEDTLEPYPSTLPGTLPDIVNNHAKLTALGQDQFWLPVSQVKHGLCDNVRLDVHFPGFPTLRFIEHTSKLKRDKIKVFEMPSNNDNMILDVVQVERDSATLFALQYLGESVFVNWPHLVEAKVIKVCDLVNVYTQLEDDRLLIKTPLNDKQKKDTEGELSAVERRYRERRGIYIGQTKVFIYALPVTGQKYVPGKDGLLKLEKQWATNPLLCPLQTVVDKLDVYDPGYQLLKSLHDIYPVGAIGFSLSKNLYGKMVKVVECLAENGTIKAEVFNEIEPDLTEVIVRQPDIIRENYMANFAMAQYLGISGHALSRITGTILVRRGESKVNIGLNLRFNARGEEIAGLSKKTENVWLLANKVHDIVKEYHEKFPEVFDLLVRNADKDSFMVKDIFRDEENMNKRMDELLDWLKQQVCYRAPRQKSNAEALDECIVSRIEGVLNMHALFNRAKSINMTFTPDKLYRSLHYLGHSPPDEAATYQLFDRVVNVRDGISVPLGAKGIVIGVHRDKERESNTVIDVVFDKEFVGGVSLRCTYGRGYKMTPASLINLSYGLRIQSNCSKNRHLNSTSPVSRGQGARAAFASS